MSIGSLLPAFGPAPAFHELVRANLDLHLPAERPEDQEWREAQRSFPDFLRRHVLLEDRGGSAFEPWPWQEELAECLPRIPRLVCLKARQLGMTSMMAGYALWVAQERGAKIPLFSQGENEAIKFLGKCALSYSRLPDVARAPTDRVLTQLLSFSVRRSYIESYPATEKAGRSISSARLALFDEYAMHPAAAKTMGAVEPTIESNPDGQLFCFSTANGVGNAFHLLWEAATQQRGWVEPAPGPDGRYGFDGRLRDAVARLGRGEWLALFLPCFARPGRDEAWWERQRDAATYKANPKLFFQESPRRVDEAFIQSGRPVFAGEDLNKQQGFLREPLPREEWPTELRAGALAFRSGELRVFALPAAGHAYYAGADVAEGLEHGDYSDLAVFDREGDREVLTLHGHWPPDVFAELIDVVARLYPGMYAIERNNHGLTVLTECDKHLKTPGLYREVAVFDPQGRELVPAKLGWSTNSTTKPMMIDELEQAIRLVAIRLSDALAMQELTHYQTLPNGGTSAPASAWDDRVISRAIAWQMRKQRGRELVFY